VNVLVPAPERFAVHKLIVASRRLGDALGRAKAFKDLSQAALLFEALVETRQGDVVADAWQEAWDRGAAWKEGISKGFLRLPENGVAALRAALGPQQLEGVMSGDSPSP
jgi:hypothetical protein